MNLNENFWKFAALGGIGIALIVALTNRPAQAQDTDDGSGDAGSLPPAPAFGVDFTPPPWLTPWRNPLPPVRDYDPKDPFGVDYVSPITQPGHIFF